MDKGVFVFVEFCVSRFFVMEIGYRCRLVSVLFEGKNMLWWMVGVFCDIIGFFGGFISFGLRLVFSFSLWKLNRLRYK